VTSDDLIVNMITFQISKVQLVSHFGDGYVWHVPCCDLECTF
jgi:hypothetical protein